MNKTLEEIRKEFEELLGRIWKNKASSIDGRMICNVNDDDDPDDGWVYVDETIWQFIQSTISQTKQELIEDKRKTEYEILNIFMQFMRNGHNLKEHDLDRIESEWALFEARNYSDLFLERLSNK